MSITIAYRLYNIHNKLKKLRNNHKNLKLLYEQIAIFDKSSGYSKEQYSLMYEIWQPHELR